MLLVGAYSGAETAEETRSKLRAVWFSSMSSLSSGLLCGLMVRLATGFHGDPSSCAAGAAVLRAEDDALSEGMRRPRLFGVVPSAGLMDGDGEGECA